MGQVSRQLVRPISALLGGVDLELGPERGDEFSVFDRLERHLAALLAGIPPHRAGPIVVGLFEVSGKDVCVESFVFEIDGTMTFATPPFVSRPYTSARFRLTACKGNQAEG